MILKNFKTDYNGSDKVWDEMFSRDGVREHYELFSYGLKQMGKRRIGQ